MSTIYKKNFNREETEVRRVKKILILITRMNLQLFPRQPTVVCVCECMRNENNIIRCFRVQNEDKKVSRCWLFIGVKS